MRPLILNLTVSLDGYIADERGGVDWLLPFTDELAAEFDAFLARVDTLLMGRLSYETALAVPGGTDVFLGRRVIVFTSRSDLAPRAGVEFSREDPVSFTARLKQQPGAAIWLYGGGQLATALSDAGLVDEYELAVQPILLGRGIPLWRSPHARTRLTAGGVRLWPDGLVTCRYTRAG
ncbi:MAG: dihydrofolate reductase family protein [Anaerolineae bacterium]